MAGEIKQQKLSLLGKIDLAFRALFVVPPQIAINLARCFTLAKIRGISRRHWGMCAVIRCTLRRLTPLQIQYVMPSTTGLYKRWTARRARNAKTHAGTDKSEAFLASRLSVDIETLPDGSSSLLWLGDRRKASKIVYFFHGGGFVVPASPGHLEWCARAYLLASQSVSDSVNGEEIAVAVLSYTMAPSGPYPTQLRQAAAGLAHILNSGVQPRNLVIGGDSAGGNLAVGILSHLLHPRPSLPEITLTEPLAGAFLVSPWVSKRTYHWPSYRRNDKMDMITAGTVESMIADFVSDELFTAEMGDAKGWSFPMDLEDPAAWFSGLEKMVREVYVTMGEQEVFLDQIVGLVDAFRTASPKVNMTVESMVAEGHDWIILEGGAREDGDAMRRMRSWVSRVFWP